MKDNTQPSLYEQNCRFMGIEPSPDKEEYHKAVRQQILVIERLSRNTFAMFAAQAPDNIQPWFNPPLPERIPQPKKPDTIPWLEVHSLKRLKRDGQPFDRDEETKAYIDAFIAWEEADEKLEHERMREQYYLWRFEYATEMYNRLMMGPKGTATPQK